MEKVRHILFGIFYVYAVAIYVNELTPSHNADWHYLVDTTSFIGLALMVALPLFYSEKYLEKDE